MKEYGNPKAEELLVDPWFLAWVKYGQPEARQFWEEWQRQHPDQCTTVLMAKDMAEALKNRPGSVSEAQVQAEIAQIMRVIRHLPAPNTTRSWLRRLSRPRWHVAALVLLSVGGGWMSWMIFNDQPLPLYRTRVSHARPTKATDWVNQVNGTSQPVAITLPDGSRMTLSPQSQARYPPTFERTKREIHLTGEAVFAVVHDSRRPFLVVSGPLITRVLGTRFRVRALQGEPKITVSVQRGKVSVYSQHDLASSQRRHVVSVPGVILTANQQVVYEADKAAYQKELVVQPGLISPNVSPDAFLFQDTPVPLVFDRLQQGYGITMTYDASLFRHCTVTASLAGVPLHDQLKLICASIGATYEVVDTHIVVTGKGCQ